MPPRAATVGRAVTGLVVVSAVRRNADAGKAVGCAFHSDNRLQILLQRPRRRAGVSFF
jgi:hypothetical protein